MENAEIHTESAGKLQRHPESETLISAASSTQPVQLLTERRVMQL